MNLVRHRRRLGDMRFQYDNHITMVLTYYDNNVIISTNEV